MERVAPDFITRDKIRGGTPRFTRPLAALKVLSLGCAKQKLCLLLCTSLAYSYLWRSPKVLSLGCARQKLCLLLCTSLAYSYLWRSPKVLSLGCARQKLRLLFCTSLAYSYLCRQIAKDERLRYPKIQRAAHLHGRHHRHGAERRDGRTGEFRLRPSAGTGTGAETV